MTVMIITPVPVTSQDDDDEILTVESNNSVKNNSKGQFRVKECAQYRLTA